LQKRRHSRGQYQELTTAGNGTKPPLRLMEAVLAGGVNANTEAGALKVLLPCGAKVLIADASQAVLAAQLLKALGVSC
jgi:hypothetical protein